MAISNPCAGGDSEESDGEKIKIKEKGNPKKREKYDQNVFH